MFEFGKNKDKIFCKYLLKYFWEMPRALIRAIHLSSANPGHYHCQENMVAQHEKTQQIQHWHHFKKTTLFKKLDHDFVWFPQSNVTNLHVLVDYGMNLKQGHPRGVILTKRQVREGNHHRQHRHHHGRGVDLWEEVDLSWDKGGHHHCHRHPSLARCLSTKEIKILEQNERKPKSRPSLLKQNVSFAQNRDAAKNFEHI